MEDPASTTSSVAQLDSPRDKSTPESNEATTPPSSLGTSSSRRRKLSTDAPLSDGASEFLSNLDNYLALGCLVIEQSTEQTPRPISDDWDNVSCLPSVPAFGEALSASLQKLASAGWIRITSKPSSSSPQFLICRLYILPFDVGHRFVDRQTRKLYVALESLVTEMDIRAETWEGDFRPQQTCKFDPYASRDEGSLFWMFNKLPSPSPNAASVKEKYAREALEDLLDPASVLPGLKTALYPYQRRSAGLMLQRESISTLDLDPRLEERTAPDGTTFYFGPRDLLFLRQPRYYETCKGGLLAETMGLGKTVICLATILATKGHPPIVPAVYSLPPVRPSVASLAEMAVSAINRRSVPWRVELERIKYATGDMMESCREKLQSNPAYYEIPLEPMRWNRKTILPPPKKMILASTTLIVVPRNLCKQWQSEIEKHVDDTTLRVLVMDDSKKKLPLPDELRTYDIVLFTRGRFELEIKDGADDQGRRIGATQLLCRCPYIGATRKRDCHCVRTDDLYDSPLKHLHFKRLIIDEGHFFSNTNATAVAVANKLVLADHRWVVSGTPAKDLLGVEVDMSAAENLWHTPDTRHSRDAVLEQRRVFSKEDATAGAIKSIGALASNFLKIMPWFADMSDRRADWDEYIYRHEDSRKRTYSGFSNCLRRTLQAMVVKTRPEDVERDIELPPLSHEVIRLEPSFYDKLTANLFTLVLTANAITSERTDVDYLFHKNSRKSRSDLIQNLRQSAFFWTGFSEADVRASLKSSEGYLKKEGTACTDSDRSLLTETLRCAHFIFTSPGWKALSRSHEIGLFVDGWPADSAEYWAFDTCLTPMLTGVSQLLEAQKHVNLRAGEVDPGEGLAGAGIKALAPTRHVEVPKTDEEKQKAEKPILTKGVPTSSLDGEPLLRRRSSAKGERLSPKKSPKSSKVGKSPKTDSPKTRVKIEPDPFSPSLTGGEITARPSPDTPNPELIESFLAPDSPYLRGSIVGTASAKLSYLISQIIKYHQDEKILVFYDGENAAYYIAQMLELLHIKHEIYARALAAHRKAEYIVRFDQDAQYRVLLMDVRHAAFGLNLPSASRIFFVNPVCRPNIEAQAIKRAHRIGQTHKVVVETLVLRGTIEENMLDRSKRMTRLEHQDAKVLEDDGGIRSIIQSARILPVYEYEKYGAGQMAPLEEPQQLWGRAGWTNFVSVNAVRPETVERKRKAPHDDRGGETSSALERPTKSARRTLDFVDCRHGTLSGSPSGAVNGVGGTRRLSQPLDGANWSSLKERDTRERPPPTTPMKFERHNVALPSPEFEPLERSPEPQDRRPSASPLLDAQRISTALSGNTLLQDILRRL